MKLLNQTLSAFALATFLAGAVLAGPSNPTAAFGTPIAAHATSGRCPMMKADANPTAHETACHHHEGCIMAMASKPACKPSGGTCPMMSGS